MKRNANASLGMRCFATALAVAGLAAGARAGQSPEVTVRVDPRVELVSIIFRLAGNPEYNQGRVQSYIDDVEAHFGKYRDHEVVRLARDLRNNRSISYDACMSMAVHLKDGDSVEGRVPFEPRPESLEHRWTSEDAQRFVEAAGRFANDTDFAGFVEKHQALYDETAARMEAVLKANAHLDWFDAFFGTPPGASFIVALGMLNGGQCYGPHVLLPDGSKELWCVLGVWKTDAEGMPAFDKSVVSTIAHEFCHSYTNPLVDKHESELKAAGEKIYPHVAEAMSNQAYGNWKTMMYESLVRASTVRYVLATEGEAAAKKHVDYEKSRHFLWTGELADVLGEYEQQREKYPTLDAFFPKIVEFFNGYAGGFAKEQGAVNEKRPHVVKMSPENGAVDVNPKTKQIRITFDRKMSGGMSVVGGGPNFPEVDGKIHYTGNKKTLIIPVKLKPNWRYEFGLNSPSFTNFRSAEGVPLEPVRVTFTTGE